MSLTVAYHSATSGLSLAERKIAVLSANINNADRAGYTRKTYQAQYLTGNGVTAPIGGKITSAVNAALVKNLVYQTSSYSYHAVASDYLSDYSAAFGGTGSDSTTLSSAINGLESALQALSGATNDSTSKAQVVSAAQQIASQLNSLARGINSQLKQIDAEIGSTVEGINQQLRTIDALNTAIVQAQARGDSTADLEDQRHTALSSLSHAIGIQYTIDGDGRATVYTSSGDLLVGSRAATLSQSDDAVLVNGKDITGTLHSGSLGALLTLRDSGFPAEMQKLDTLASELAEAMNSITSEGTAVPPRSSITSGTAITSGQPLAATGSWRVAVTDAAGKVSSLATLDLSSYATMGDLVAALDAIDGVTAGIGSDGKLTLAASGSGQGIALSSMDSDIEGASAAQWFGFNALFTGHSAATLKVSDYLLADSNALPMATLSSSPTLAAGDRGFSDGDTSIADALAETLGTGNPFPPSGNFGARIQSFAQYASSIIASAAMQASSATGNAATAEATYNATAEKLSSETGVNINEEMALMTELQNYYEANATVIATLRELFSTLMQSYR